MRNITTGALIRSVLLAASMGGMGGVESTPAAPLRVYVLAGQSNMEGHGYAEPVTWLPPFDRPQASLTNLAKHPTWGDEFKKFLPTGGKYPSRTDVWCHYQKEGSQMIGNLSVGYGANDTSRAMNVGPELGFGWVMGDSTAEQVLLIKTAWGGKSLAKDFRPPGAGGTTGEYYNKMISQVKGVLADIKKHFPAYDGQGYKLAGFGWHQGWNDFVNDAYVNEYETNLFHLIRDIRKDWNAPGLPVVIAESGMACFNPNDQKAQKLCAAQAAPATAAEFKGTVAYVRARDFYDTSLSPWKDWGYHWHGSFYSYYRVGKAMGESMRKLEGGSPVSLSGLAGKGRDGFAPADLPADAPARDALGRFRMLTEGSRGLPGIWLPALPAQP